MTDRDASDLRGAERARAVYRIFDSIAHRYDLLNHLLSFGVDILWRRRLCSIIAPDLAGKRVIDIGCGTADLTIALAKAAPTAEIVGVDFVEKMIALARKKIERAPLARQIELKVGDALDLEFDDASFDAAISAFVLRNLADMRLGAGEIARVLKPGALGAILEFSMPTNRLIKSLYSLYFLKTLPFIGGMVSGDKEAYRYLPESTLKFPRPEEILDLLTDAGFENCRFIPFTFGICGLYLGSRSADAANAD